MDNTSFTPENNSINNSVPPPTPQYSAPERRHFLNKKFIVTFVILLLLGSGAYASIWYWQNQQVAEEVVPTFTPRAGEAPNASDVLIENGQLIFKPGNFSLMLAPGWSVADASLPLPPNFFGPQFAFVKDGTNCVFAYVDDTSGNEYLDQLKQTSPGERVYVGKSQIDSWWWVPKSNLPSDFKVSFDTRQPFPHEILIGSTFSIATTRGNASFLLYSKDGSIVPQECEQDNVTMLKTLTQYFNEVSLDRSSDGVLRSLATYISGGSILAFKSFNSHEYKKLNTSSLYSPYFEVFNDRLYTLSQNTITVYDPFGRQEKALDGIATSKGEAVSGFFIKDDTLWYLLGKPGCADYMAQCNLKLYEIPAVGGTPKLLSSSINLESGSIMGFDSQDKVLYLLGSFGDAGAYHYTIYAYSYKDGSVKKVVEDGGAEGDLPAEHAQANSIRNSIEVAIAPEPIFADYVRVLGGHLTMPTETEYKTASNSYHKNFIFPTISKLTK